jgi:hypothetical protein
MQQAAHNLLRAAPDIRKAPMLQPHAVSRTTAVACCNSSHSTLPFANTAQHSTAQHSAAALHVAASWPVSSQSCGTPSRTAATVHGRLPHNQAAVHDPFKATCACNGPMKEPRRTSGQQQLGTSSSQLEPSFRLRPFIWDGGRLNIVDVEQHAEQCACHYAS